MKITGAVPEWTIYIKVNNKNMGIKKVIKSVAKKVVAPIRRQKAAAKVKETDLMERHRKMQSGKMPYRY